MKLDKLTVLKILGIAGAAIFFYWALQNLSLLADGLAAQYPGAASPRLLHGVRAEHPNALF